MQRSPACLLLCIVGGAAVSTASSASAQIITFRKVADTDTPIPNGGGTFTGFSSSPVLDAGQVAFTGTGLSGQVGIYTDPGGVLRVVADTNTQAPGGTETFLSIFLPSIDDGSVAFRGSFRRDMVTINGVFLETNGAISTVADTNTPAPGTGGTFTHFGSSLQAKPSLDNGNVAFAAGSSLGPFGGLYLSVGGTLSVVADANTPMPAGSGNFGLLGSPSLSGMHVAFSGTDGLGLTGEAGIYTSISGVLDVVVDKNTLIPGGSENFQTLATPSIDGTGVAFLGVGSDPFQRAPYTSFDGTLESVGSGSLLLSFEPSLQNRAVTVSHGSGIIRTTLGGTLLRVMGSGDVLDGKAVSLAYCTAEAMSGREIVFFVLFDDASRGVYVAQILIPCGDGTVDPDEECDDGNTSNNDDCLTDCTLPTCGDGFTWNEASATEECDDGNNEDGDGCTALCVDEFCGDGIVNDSGREICDEGSGNSNDCCTDSCTLEDDTHVCRSAEGVCDAAELCDASSTTCPFDEVALQGTVCRPSTSPDACDPLEACDGSSKLCPDDIMTTVCQNDDDCCPPGCIGPDPGNNDPGNDNDCPKPTPTVSAWGLLILALLLMVAGKVYYDPRRVSLKSG